MTRKLTFAEAKAQYIHRFTMEHVPAWARERVNDTGYYYAPQFRSDREWYDHTRFYGEAGHFGTRNTCYTSGQTWPLGQWLDKPFSR